MVTGLHKTDVQRVTASTLFSDVHGCPVVWNDDICATVQWALILVRAYSGHKRPGRAEGRSSGMSRLSSPGPCDFCWGTKQGYKPNFGFIFLAELPETHICRFQDEHSYQKKSCMRYCMNERSKTLKQREKRKTPVYFVWDGLEIVEYVTKLKFSRQLSWGWGLKDPSQYCLQRTAFEWLISMNQVTTHIAEQMPGMLLWIIQHFVVLLRVKFFLVNFLWYRGNLLQVLQSKWSSFGDSIMWGLLGYHFLKNLEEIS